MANSVQISASFNESQLAQSLDRAVQNWSSKGGLSKAFSGQGTAFNQLNSGARSFDSTLASVNKRVLSFGASLGVIGGSVRVFRDLVSATLQVDQSLARINSVMALTIRQTEQLKTSLFDIARKSGESWAEVSAGFEAASKTGGNFQQVLDKVRVASNLAKVSGIEVTDAVQGLNTAFSVFGRTGETWVTTANKVSAANRSFLVSSQDLLKAIGQFGPQAQDAGISLNRLVGIVTALKTITGRDGPAISQSLQRIFARLQENANLGKLSGIVNPQDDNGNLKSGIQLLDELAKRYKTLSDAQKNLVSQTVGGIFSPAIFKALVQDLGEANGIAARTSELIGRSTDDLNTRLRLQTNNLKQALDNLKTTGTQIGSAVGNLTLGPTFKLAARGSNALSGILDPQRSQSEGEKVGTYLAQGVLKGVGNVLSGPGLVLIGRLFAGVVRRTIPEVLSDAKQLIGGGGTPRGRDLEAVNAVNQALAVGTREELQRVKAARSVAEAEEAVLAILERQAALQGQLARRNALLFEAGLGVAGQLRGEVPHSASGYVGAMHAESRAISAGVGGAPAGSRPVYMPNFARGGGQSGIVANNSEFIVPGAGGPSIYNRAMIRQIGLPPGSVPVAAGGYVPHAAESFEYGSLKSKARDIPDPYLDLIHKNVSTPVANETIDKLNDLFKTLGDQKTTQGAAAIRISIHDISNTLDPVSRRTVRTKAASVFGEVDAAERAAANKAPQLGPPISAFEQAQRQQLEANQTRAKAFTEATATGRIPSIDQVYAQARTQEAALKAQQMEAGFRTIKPAPLSLINRDQLANELKEGFSELERRGLQPINQMMGRAGGVLQHGPFISSAQLGNASIAGLGGVVPYGPRVSGDQLSVLQRQQSLREQLQGARFVSHVGTSGGNPALPNSATPLPGDRIYPTGTLPLPGIPDSSSPVTLDERDGVSARAQRRTRFEKRASLINLGLLGADFGTGFIPEGTSGKASGIISGGFKTSLQAGATGAGIGSLFGPLGTLIGGGAGLIGGGIYGAISRSKESFDELAKSITEVTTANQQALLSVSSYVQAQNLVQDAKDSGESPRTIETLRRSSRQSLDALPADVKAKYGAQLVSAGDDTTKLNQVLAGIQEESFQSSLRGTAQLDILGLGNGTTDTTTAAHSLSRVLSTNKGVGGIKNTSDLLGVLAGSGFDDGAIGQAYTNLNKLPPSAQAELISKVKAETASDQSLNALSDQKANRPNPEGAINRLIRNSITGLQDQVDAGAGYKSFLRRESALRLSGAARILGEGGRLSVKGKSLDSNDLESQFALSQANEQADVLRQTALDSAKVGFLKYLDKAPLDAQTKSSIHAGITTGTQVDTFKGVLNQLTPKGQDPDEKLSKIVTLLSNSFDQAGREVQLVQEQVNVQKLELQAAQHNALLTRGTYNRSTISSFGNLVAAGRASTNSPLDRINAQIQQGELLDSLGIPKSENTVAIQEKLRAQSVNGTLAGLAGQALGRPVATNQGSLTLAANRLYATGDPRNRELASRIRQSFTTRDFDPHAAAQRLLAGDGANAKGLQGLSDAGKITLGEAGIISSIDKLTAVLTNPSPGQGANVNTKATPDNPSGTQQGDGSAKSPIVMAAYTVTTKPTPSRETAPSSPLSSFGAGFASQAAQFKSQVDDFRQIGEETANTLESSFSSFWGNFITGAARGQQAFRQFASSTLADVSKLFSESAIKQLFGALGGALGGSQVFAPDSPAPHALGGVVGYANGGSVPTMLTGGEVIIGPRTASRIGRPTLDAINQGRMGYAGGGDVGVVQGGSGLRDDVPANLPRGSYVIKKSSAAGLMARGGAGYLHRDVGGAVDGIFGGSNSAVGYGIVGSLLGGILGAVLDKKNRGQGALIGAGLGFGAGYFGSSLFASPVSNASTNGIAQDDDGISGGTGSGSGRGETLQGILTKFGLAGATAGVGYLSSSHDKTLDTQGVINNRIALENEQQGVINNRTPGSFIDLRKAANGQYSIIDAGGPNGGGYGNPAATEYGYAGGGSVGDLGYTPSTASSASPVQANIVIHNYGNGQSSSSATVSNQDQNNPLGTQQFADKLNKAVNQAVSDQLVEQSRSSGLFNTNQRYNPNPFTR